MTNNSASSWMMSKSLSKLDGELSFLRVTGKWNKFLPVLLMLVFAVSLWPGILPPNFNAATAIAFCGAIYFRGSMAWWLPLGVLVGMDLVLNLFYYHVSLFTFETLVKPLGFVAVITLGKLFAARDSWFKLLGGGLLGAILFYLITNTAAWFNDAGYAKTLAGWAQALTTGLPGYPPTWEFFRNTLMSGGLFTALFVASAKTVAAESPADKEAGARAPEGEAKPESEPEDAKA